MKAEPTPTREPTLDELRGKLRAPWFNCGTGLVQLSIEQWWWEWCQCALIAINERGPLTSAELAHALQVPEHFATALMNELEAEGCVYTTEEQA